MKKTYAITAAAVAAVALLILCLSLRPKESDSQQETKPEYKHLNEALDNSMSEIDELKGLDKEMSRYLRKWPKRLRRPWDSPSKNTGVSCHLLLQCTKVKSENEVAQ